MKKSKFLALALAGAITLTGAGYAYWTDTLTVNNTVSTGELNVAFTQGSVTSLDGTAKDYVNEQVVSQDAKNVTLEMLNLYPGASVDFDARFDNTGTIPTLVNGISLTDDSTNVPNGKTYISDEQKSSILVSGAVIHYKADGTQIRSYGLPRNTTLANLGGYLQYGKEFRLEPKEYVVIDFKFTLNPALVDNQVENVYVKSDVSVDFKQHNAK